MQNKRYYYSSVSLQTGNTVTGCLNIIPTPLGKFVYQIIVNDIFKTEIHTVNEEYIWRIAREKEVEELEDALATQMDDVVNIENKIAKIKKFKRCNYVGNEKACNKFMINFSDCNTKCRYNNTEFGICMAKIQHIEYPMEQLLDEHKNGRKELIGYVCGYCRHTDIEQYDIFCKHCGIKFK